MFWRCKRNHLADDAARAASDLAEKTLIIGPAGVALLLGVAAVGAATAYVVTKGKKNSAG